MAAATDRASDLLITLSDLALLAHVQRPVVSMWRKRPSRTGVPFPEPVENLDGQDLFDAQVVVDWLISTGRGNNPEARDDVAAFATLRRAPLREEAVFSGVTALLCLIAITGSLPDDADELLDMVDEADPDDEFIYAEIESLGDRLTGLARYAALLASAAYSPAVALEKLLAERFRLGLNSLAQTDLRSPVRDLGVQVARALGTDAEFDPLLFVDPTPAGSDVLVDLARLVADEFGSVEVATPGGTGPAARLFRRRLRTHGIPRRELQDDGAGGFLFPEGSVVVVQLPPLSDPAMSDEEVVASVDQIALGCTAGQRVLVLGPATALTDRSPDPEITRVRRDVLKTDLVRAIVRLPAGLATQQGRRRLALWCLGPAPAGRQADGTVGRFTLTADIAGGPLAAPTVDALVADLVAGMNGPRGTMTHAFQLCRPVPSSKLQLEEGNLVSPGAPVAPTEPAVEAIEALRSLANLLSRDLGPYAPPAIRPLRDRNEPRRATVEDALARGHLLVRPGVRLDPADLTDEVGLTVITAEFVRAQGRGLPRTINQLVLAARYPTSRLTEPGDVIFCTAPRPAAWVERAGGAVVSFPARILRCVDAGLVPDLIAADINQQQPQAKAWRAWSLRYVPTEQRQALAAQLAALAGHRIELLDRLAALQEFETTMLSVVAGGSVDLTPTDSTHHVEGHS